MTALALAWLMCFSHVHDETADRGYERCLIVEDRYFGARAADAAAAQNKQFRDGQALLDRALAPSHP